ncbi:tRNA lysidine(34) synthetase TilS [Flavobacteriaceae bacterium]|nr:tRNA lysidine(34) synthetase TilS [Flavobacteriaceae bacterium]
MLNILDKHIENDLSFLKDKKLLVCVSGGVDSMVLLNLLHKMNFKIGVAHCNFKLRNKESDDDSLFVKNICKISSIPFFSKYFDINIPKYSVQMSARKLRYEWFYQLLEIHKYDYILTAHHLNDSIETFLINLIRSTGIDGLTGIKSINNKVIRPLLYFNKSQIMNYAFENKIQWREDSSNKKNDYLRNKIRNKLLPVLKDIDSDFINNFSNTIDRLKDSSLILKQYTESFKSLHFIENNDQILILKSTLINLSETMIFNLFNDYGFKNPEQILNLCSSKSGKIITSKLFSLLSNRTQLVLKKNISNVELDYFYNTNNDFFFPENIIVEEGSFVIDNKSLYLKKSEIKFPLSIRRWQSGDLIYPTGMNGKKLVSKLLKDNKLSVFEKDKQYVLCDQDHILWVIGIRFDKRKYSNINSNLKISIFEK